MVSTKTQIREYASGATGANLSVSSTPVSLDVPSGGISYLIWIYNPTGSGIRIFVIEPGSENLTSGITVGEGETLSSLGPFFAEDIPQIVATGAGTIYVTWVAITSEA